MMDKSKFLKSGLLEAYILGLSSPEEKELVESYIRKYPELESKIKQAKTSMSKFAEENMPSTITPKAKADFFQNFSVYPFFVLLLTSAIIYLTLQNFQKGALIKEQQATIIDIVNRCEAQKNMAMKDPAILAVVGNEATKTVVLTGTEKFPNARATVYWNSNMKKACCDLTGLPKIGENYQYQIWADVDGEMINLGLLDQSESNWCSFTFLGSAGSLNITIEEEGGSPHPNVDQLLVHGEIG